MALGAALLSILIIRLDNRLGMEAISKFPWLYANQPEGARAVLSTVAGSMITVAGVSFSMTLLAVSHASAQMGPRLLSSFMRDRGNQITLGTFIATFVYCLLVLRTVRNGVAAGNGREEAISPFVPHLGVLIALILAMASVAVLIYFIHHVPQSINVTEIIDQTGAGLVRTIETLFPEEIGDPARPQSEAEESPVPEAFQRPAGDGAEVCGRWEDGWSKGYVRRIDRDALLTVAQREDLVVEVAQRPGDFVCGGMPILRVWPADALDDDLDTELRATVSLGAQRSPTQDLLFAVDQLIEVAARALSPGVNDPFTALECINQLQAGLIALAQRRQPDAYRLDDQGTLRVIAEPYGFQKVAEHALGSLRGYVQRDAMVSLHLLQAIATVGSQVRTGGQRRMLRDQLEALAEAARQTLSNPRDIERVEAERSRGLKALA